MATIIADAPAERAQKLVARVRKHSQSVWSALPRFHVMMWLCIALACVGASWFSYQCLLVPQPARYAPDWQQSRWVQAADGIAPVAYFHFTTSLNVEPDDAFITIAANQVFTLYVNGNFAGSNAGDFVKGVTSQAYMYDVTSWLKIGVNALAVRVSNLDEQTPSLRANLGVVIGRSVFYYGTGNGWQATMQSLLVYPRYSTRARVWAERTFDASIWPAVDMMTNSPLLPLLTVNPLIYEQPLPLRWMSAGAGRNAYFVRQLSLPFPAGTTWLRIAATGTATVFINGKLSIVWSGQTHSTGINEINYLSYSEPRTVYRPGLALGTYNISPYLHPGVNVIAIYVASPGVTATALGLGSLSAAAVVDLLASDVWGHTLVSSEITDWHASHAYIAGWTDGNVAALAWNAPTAVGRPGAVHTFYRPDSGNLLTPDESQRGMQIVPLSLIGEVVLLTITAVLALWLSISLVVMRRFFSTRRETLEILSLAYIPAIACEALLLALSREPQMPQPFPYTWSWGLLLLLLLGASFVLLCQNSVKRYRQHRLRGHLDNLSMSTEPHKGLLEMYAASAPHESSKHTPSQEHDPGRALLVWLRLHWPLVVIFLVAIPLISYDLSYEPYWQDELSSYYAAKGILAHGLPFFPSGFLYTKAELHSYLLALWMLVFGDAAAGPRLLSVVEYLISIPLLYLVGCYFFERRVALLATAMLALSPVSLVWGRQVRMYEQAQVLTLLTVYLFYKAVQEHKRVRPVYLAMACLLCTYLSHEETFIILPALLICVLMVSMGRADERGRMRLLPAVLYQKHWWYATLLGSAIIGLQLLATHLTHPPMLGTDQSERPFIQLTTDNIPFYVGLLFAPSGHEAWIVINSLLATAGCWWARRSSDPRIRYCAVFLLVSFLTLVLTFTMQADRYFYPLLPIYYLMGAWAMLTMLRALWDFAKAHLILHRSEPRATSLVGGYLSRPLHIMLTCTVAILCSCVLIVPIVPLSGYNLFISRLIGFSYHRHYADYDAAAQYLRQHWREGDVVLCVSPDFTVYYYTGHADAFFSIDRALFLMERQGHIVGTSIGGQALLNQNDLQAILDQHKRVWVVSDNSLYQSLTVKRFTFPPDMHIVFEGYGSAVYLRGG